MAFSAENKVVLATRHVHWRLREVIQVTVWIQVAQQR